MMTRFSRAFAVALLALPNAARAQTPASACVADSGRELRQRLPALMDSAMIPGLALAIINDGKVVWSGGLRSGDSASGRGTASRTVVECALFRKPAISYCALELVRARQPDLR